MALPTIGRIVIYRHPLPKGGSYDVPAIVSATAETIREARATGLDIRHVRELSSDEHLHLTVFSPLVTHPDGVEHARDVAPATDEPAAGTWRWPPRPQPLSAEQQAIGHQQPVSDDAIRRIAEEVNRRNAQRAALRGNGWGV